MSGSSAPKDKSAGLPFLASLRQTVGQILHRLGSLQPMRLMALGYHVTLTPLAPAEPVPA